MSELSLALICAVSEPVRLILMSVLETLQNKKNAVLGYEELSSFTLNAQVRHLSMDVSERLYNTNAKNVCSYTTPQVLCLTVINTKIGTSDIFHCLLLFPCVIKKEKKKQNSLVFYLKRSNNTFIDLAYSNLQLKRNV